jgi:calcineurin-like phosphoesterase family protein
LNQYLAEGKTVDYLVHGHTHEFNKTSIVDNHNGKMVENNVSWEAWYRPVSIDELVKTDAMWEK